MSELVQTSKSQSEPTATGQQNETSYPEQSPVVSGVAGSAKSSRVTTPDDLLRLQRHAGNQATLRFISEKGLIQRQLDPESPPTDPSVEGVVRETEGQDITDGVGAGPDADVPALPAPEVETDASSTATSAPTAEVVPPDILPTRVTPGTRVYSITDARAYIRNGPPNYGSTSVAIPVGTRVTVFEYAQRRGRPYVYLIEAVPDGFVGPPRPIGWTWAGNLDAEVPVPEGVRTVTTDSDSVTTGTDAPSGPVTLDEIRESLHGLTVTERDRHNALYINPALMVFVPHVPRLGRRNPRHVIFGSLSTALQTFNALPSTATQEQRQAAQADVDEEAGQVHDQIIRYLRGEASRRRRLRRDLSLDTDDALYEHVRGIDVTTTVSIASHDIAIGERTVHLEPVQAGSLIERPGGFGATVTTGPRDRSVTAHTSQEAMDAALAGITGERLQIAQNYLAVIRRGEGSLSSLNTWDRLRVTLGSGLGAAGRLQDTFMEFKQRDPAAFRRLFGRFGIDVVPPRRGGNASFRVTTEAGDVLEGTAATEYIANTPALLGVLVNAGFDTSWQQDLISGAAASIQFAFTYSFSVTANERTTAVNLYDLLNGHVAPNLVNVCMFTIADERHGAGAVSDTVRDGLVQLYLQLAEQHQFDPHTPTSMPDVARTALAQQFARQFSHPNRRTHTARVLGLGSFEELFAGAETSD